MNPFVIAFRRIIYSIPLKRLLVGLAVFSVLLASFSSAVDLPSNGFNSSSNEGNFLHYYSEVIDCSSTCNVNISDSVYFVCFRRDPSSSSLKVSFNNGTNWLDTPYFDLYCTMNKSIQFKNGKGLMFYFKSGDGIVYEKYTSLECQTEYNLIPIESIDQNYCTTNNLCPTYDCPTNPIGTGSLSNLYINNILHIGAPNIIMNIPEEIDWDYAYTMGGNTMNIDIFGYNQDYEKIEDWIYTNNYKPSSEDFTNIFTNFSNFGGLLIATLFVILVFYYVKKIFK